MAPGPGSNLKVPLGADKGQPSVGKEPLAAQRSETLEPHPISYWALFRGADYVDLCMMFVGLIAALGNGALFPLFTIIFSRFLNSFGNFVAGSASDFTSQVSSIALDFLYVAIAAAAASYLETALFMLSGNRQTNRLKQHYLDAVLKQDIAFFDVHATTGGLLQGLNDDSIAVQQAISEKCAMFVHYVATFIVGIIIAFTKGWDMTLVLLGCVPFLILIGAVMAQMTTTLAKKSTEAYTEASSIAQQTISQIRTVVAYGQEPRAHAEYTRALDEPLKVGIRSAWVAGLSLGGLQFVMFGTYAVALFYGSYRVAAGAYTGGQVMNVLFSTLIGGFSLGMAGPNVAYFAKGRAAGARMFAVINRSPLIVIEEGGEEPSSVIGEVQLTNIRFAYPARPDVLVFRDFCLTVPAGKTVALVGGSGSGKSTVVSLVERFYDPAEGSVTLDGIDIRSLSLRWLRSQVGLVSQEPTLFATTIFENIAMGRPDATGEEVEAAARSANAHNFVSSLPEGYHTQVGERGMQLSGGQKQRIAIARAILKNPKVLLLDEATSALDTESERVVQEALDRMVVGRTTLVIAHRLSTIKLADAIAVVRAGQVVEQGTHDELLRDPAGAYSMLVQLQMQHQADEAVVIRKTTGSTSLKGAGSASLSPRHVAGEADLTAKLHTSGSSRAGSLDLRGEMSSLKLLGGGAGAGDGSGIHAADAAAATVALAVPQLAVADMEKGHLAAGAESTAHALHTAAMSLNDGGVGSAGCLSWLCCMRLRRSNRSRDCSDAGASSDKDNNSAFKKQTPEGGTVEVSLWRLVRLNRPEWGLGLLGGIASGLTGCQQPAFSFVLSSMIVEFYKTNADDIKKTASFYSWMFFVIAVGSLLTITAQQVSFGTMGQQLARRIRLMLFAAILRQEVGWFDREENSSGRLTSGLATDATHVRGAVGDVMGLVLQNLTTFAFGYFIAFYYDWRMALLITGCAPLVIAASALQMKMVAGSVSTSDKLYAGANQSITDAFAAIRTIQAFNLQRAVCSIYSNLQSVADRAAVRQANISGVAQGFANFTMFALYAMIIWFGGLEISRGWTTFEGMLKAFMAVLLAAMGIVQASMGFPDIAKAQSAIQNIFPIIDRQPLIVNDADPAAGVDSVALTIDSPAAGAVGRAGVPTMAIGVPAAPARGELAFVHVMFAYPSRLSVMVFKDFCLHVPAGQMVALVGESGSGKSTVVGLVERFYDAQGGSITLDGVDIRQISLRWLRSQIALVSQEPLLFRGSILHNIRFGRPDATEEEVRAAAAAANALEFVEALPEGMDTLVGEGGVQLSGGQKQRIAIARAVVKNPKILLLDEATSALDTQSESVVQAALDRIMDGRTSLVIAHRLSTVRSADAIAVMFKGVILEQGKHADLMKLQGNYARLVMAQSRTGKLVA